MLKYVIGFAGFVVMIGLIGAGVHLYKVAARNKKEMAVYAGKEKISVKPFGKTAVVYYSLTGKTENIAQKIAEKTNAALYKIDTETPLPKGALLHVAVKNQIKTKEYPALKALPDLSEYDVVFVGAPVWWYTVATPMLSFLNQTDFANKKVVPFSTQGSNVGTYFEDFAINAKNARLLTHESFNNLSEKYNGAVDNKIAVWLNALDID